MDSLPTFTTDLSSSTCGGGPGALTMFDPMTLPISHPSSHFTTCLSPSTAHIPVIH